MEIRKQGWGQKKPDLHMTLVAWYRIYTNEVTKFAHAMRCREEKMVWSLYIQTTRFAFEFFIRHH